MRDRSAPALRLLPVLLAGVVLAACGSSGGSTTAASTPASDGSSSSAPSTPAASTPAASDTPSAASGDDFCQEIVAQKTALTTNELPKLLASGSPAAWKAYLVATSSMNDRLFDKAPDELKSAVDELRTENQTLSQTMAAAGYDIHKVKLTTLIAVINSADFKKASATFAAYAKDHCSLDLTKA